MVSPIRLSILFVVFFSCTSAWADISSTWQVNADQQKIKVDYRDAKNIRVQISPTHYVLLKGETLFSVNNGAVMNLTAITSQMKQFGLGGIAPQAKGAYKKDDVAITLKKTGKTETHAGMKGAVYVVEATNPKTGKKMQQEIVLRKDQELLSFQKAMMRFAETSMGSFGMSIDKDMNDALGQQVISNHAVLRYGKDIALLSISKRTLDDSLFTLPKSAQVSSPFSGLGAMMQNMTQQQK